MKEGVKMTKKKRELDPIKGTWPNPKTVVCRDCVHRDKTIVGEGENRVAVGVTRSYCDVYTKTTGGKPMDILFQGADCDYYMKEEDDD